MPNLKEIKRRIQSVKNTQQITKAMKLVAASKLRKAQHAILEARPYAIKMMDVLNHLAARCNSDLHPLLDVREGNRHLLLIITSDKGLCGGFNGSVIRKTANYLKENGQNENSLIIAGKKGNDIFRNRPVTITEEIIGWSKDFDYLKAQSIGENLAEMFAKKKIDKVFMVYNEFKSVMQQEVVVEQLLPVLPEKLAHKEDTFVG
ncbi:MAG: ATP synthase F1 subunit gamma, partial [Rhodospirillaceae bacterium]|nr:ATP synthase F1 subunit gamma [Rhodospirillaceae bacterium]